MLTKIIIVSLLIFFLQSCSKDDFSIVNLNGNQITVLGHAGMGQTSSYPMNSLESIMKCLNQGADGTECDLQITSDSVLVLYRNEDLSDNTSLHGQINSMTWEELHTAKYTDLPYLDYSIASLDQVLKSVTNPSGYTFTFDCKLYTANMNSQYYETFAGAIMRIIEKYGLEQSVCIESQNEEFLALLKNKRPTYKLFIYHRSFNSGMEIATRLNLCGISTLNQDITTEQVGFAHSNNIRVALWNVLTIADNKEAISKSPDYIQSDRLANLVKLLK